MKEIASQFQSKITNKIIFFIDNDDVHWILEDIVEIKHLFSGLCLRERKKKTTKFPAHSVISLNALIHTKRILIMYIAN